MAEGLCRRLRFAREFYRGILKGNYFARDLGSLISDNLNCFSY
jgi:hypothetical protein